MQTCATWTQKVLISEDLYLQTADTQFFFFTKSVFYGVLLCTLKSNKDLKAGPLQNKFAVTQTSVDSLYFWLSLFKVTEQLRNMHEFCNPVFARHYSAHGYFRYTRCSGINSLQASLGIFF